MTAAVEDAHVELDVVSKSYGGIHAVREVSLAVRRGTVHAIVGENGAGKSTVSKLIAGAISPTGGRLMVSGREVSYGSPRQALADGIAMMDQELAMVPHRSVMENVFLGSESRQAGFVRRGEQRRRFAELLERSGFDLDGRALVSSLRLADQQKVEILRALARNAELIIMDEPTAPLSMVESEQLFDIIRSLRDRGTTIIYISHFLEEVLEISDVVTVMRDGRHIRTGPSSEETQDSLVQGMLGRSLDLAFPERVQCAPDSEPLLEVRDLSLTGSFKGVSFDVRPGEIVGLAGLIGSGRTEVVRAIFGADRYESGRVTMRGRALRGSPAASIRHGLVMLPESRQHDGLIMMRSVAENAALACLQRFSTLGFMRRRRQRDAVAALIADLAIKTSSDQAVVDSLSGGNQQKVVFAKCLMAGPEVLIVDEPTRGVDVGAKRAIYELLVSLAANGMAVIVISSEVEEVLGLAHRVIVMRRGRLVAEFAAEEASEERVLAAAFGTTSNA
ncbi:sugar ABC transporter ATP-binding protein [Microbacterium sp. A8/3-1]|uniref:Sugar ABC transporter ATP-binding protein n=1 Tax=Microbacterium sp. A8/3-1 TaxID=3160749 RepID=A0AAU7VVZ5_9MICO